MKTQSKKGQFSSRLYHQCEEATSAFRKDASNRSSMSITANVDKEISTIHEKISLLKQKIKDTQDSVQQEKLENNKLEENISEYMKENERLVNDNRKIERKVNQVIQQLKSTHQLMDTITSKMTKIDNEISKINNNQHYSTVISASTPKPAEFKGTYLTINKINKIKDVVTDMQPIGHGGEGRVYRATLKSNGRKVVVKSYFMDCEQSSRIEYAMLILCSNIRGVKSPLGLFNTTSNSYLIMEDNHKSIPLDSYCKQNQLTENQIQYIFSQMAHILLELKKRFIKHRDVKLDNFLLDIETGRLTIIDFGWAMYSALDNVSMDEVKRSGETLMGTNDYLPPEVDCAHGTTVSYDKATVFALGCVLLELYFGYQGNVRHILHKMKLNDYIEQLKKGRERSLSKGAASVLEKCLRMNSRDRFSLEDTLSHPWLPSAKHNTNIFRSVASKGGT